jgi:hypothetical protein
MSKATQNFTAEDLKSLETAADAERAKVLLRAIVEKASTSKYPIKPEKVQALYNNIARARNKNEVVAIGWNMLLVGEGLASVNSKYQKRYA